MIAFIVTAAIVFALLVLLDGYATHMGNPDSTDWATIVVVSVLSGLVGMALWVGFLEATAIVSGLLS